MFRVLVLFCCVGVALAGEWNCADTSGTFDLSTDCTMTNEVAVSGDLTVTGQETVYSTLTAASKKRHFQIISAVHTLRLQWLNMTGGDPGDNGEGGSSGNSGDDRYGGSIHVKDVAAHLNISHCVFFNNRASRGGAVHVGDGQPTLFFSSVLFESNSAIYRGGAVYLSKATFHGQWNTFKKNRADYGDGGAMVILDSTVSSTGSSYIKNTAIHRGGGISIEGNSVPAPSQMVRVRRRLLLVPVRAAARVGAAQTGPGRAAPSPGHGRKKERRGGRRENGAASSRTGGLRRWDDHRRVPEQLRRRRQGLCCVDPPRDRGRDRVPDPQRRRRSVAATKNAGAHSVGAQQHRPFPTVRGPGKKENPGEAAEVGSKGAALRLLQETKKVTVDQ
jgi:predicted outer membrane repeat protein